MLDTVVAAIERQRVIVEILDADGGGKQQAHAGAVVARLSQSEGEVRAIGLRFRAVAEAIDARAERGGVGPGQGIRVFRLRIARRRRKNGARRATARERSYEHGGHPWL